MMAIVLPEGPDRDKARSPSAIAQRKGYNCCKDAGKDFLKNVSIMHRNASSTRKRMKAIRFIIPLIYRKTIIFT